MIRIEGRGNIWAEILCDSVNPWGDRLTTWRVHYPRMILAEVNTHRKLTRSSSSSRAIPVNKMIEYVEKNPAMPIHWGKNQAGMQAYEENDAPIKWYAYDEECEPTIEYDVPKEQAWVYASSKMIDIARRFADAGYHKQIVNRLLEPWQFMNTVISATDISNFYWLRCDSAAQPEFQELANCMRKAQSLSEPMEIRHGEWHTPYINRYRDSNSVLHYVLDGEEIDKDTAIKTSCAAVAQVSYRKNDTSEEKVKRVFNLLRNGDKLHGCYDKDTMLLLDTGEWVCVKDYDGVSPIAVYNGADDSIHFESPSKWNIYYNVPDMIHVSGMAIDLLTTPDHRQYVSTRVNNSWSDYHIETSLSIFNKSAKYLTSGNIISDGVDYPVSMKFLGFYIGDGHEKGDNVTFHLRKTRKVQFLHELNYEIKIWGKEVYCVPDVSGNWLRNNCRDANSEKVLPKDYINMTKQQWEDLKVGLFNSDGSRDKNSWGYFTTSKTLAEQIQTLAHIHGEYCSVRHTIRDETRKDIYVLHFSKRITPEVSCQQKGRSRTYRNEIVQYNDTVYCPTVSTGLVLVKRNSKIMISGNSAFESTATPFSEDEYMVRKQAFNMLKENGIPDNQNLCLYNGNFKGWTQYRKMIPGECH